MRLAVSNIAWPREQDEAVHALLRASGVEGIELAPTTLWPDPLAVAPAAVDACRERFEALGLPVISLQALLFGQPQLALFGADEARDAMRDYLAAIVRLGGRLGARALVFGSPRNRTRGELPLEPAMERAARFFRELGAVAREAGTCLCIEPNPPRYACDFVTDAASAVELVRRVDDAGFGLHLDAAALVLAGDDLEGVLADALPLVRHFHASEVDLAPLGAGPEPATAVPHERFGASLRRAGYAGFVSMEMRAVEGAGPEALRGPLAVLRRGYGD